MRLLSVLYSGTVQRTFQLAALGPLAAPQQERPPTELYRLLKAYYLNNGLYEELYALLHVTGVWQGDMKPLRNPAHEVVEFHAAKLFGGEMEVEPDADAQPAIKELIEQVWKWSNWKARKTVAARWLAMYGDLFIKVGVNERGDRVYFQLTDPQYVTDFETDERGFVIYIRTDIPQVKRDAQGRKQDSTLTEVWDKARNRYVRWDHSFGQEAGLDLLGGGEEKELSSFGIDFVPYVHAKFRDIGEDRGMGAFLPALDMIDESNRQATRLHQMLFRHNNVTWALRANQVDATGRPIAAPMLDGTQKKTVDGKADVSTVTLGDDRLIRLPGMAELDSMVPQLPYGDALAILIAQQDAIRDKCPELEYQRMKDLGAAITGRAVRLLLGPTVDRALEARENGEQALARADAMALTIGKSVGIDGFGALGEFDNGDFEHCFKDRPIIPESDYEKWETKNMQATVLTVWKELGIPRSKLWGTDGLGYSEDEIQEMEDEETADEAAQGSAILDAFETGSNGNVGGGNAPNLGEMTDPQAARAGRSPQSSGGAGSQFGRRNGQ